MNESERAEIIDQYNTLNEQKWDLLDQIAEIDLGRIALLSQLRESES